jgi:hypothetical protein
LACVVAVPATAADEPPTRKELLTSQNNLKQIAIAFHSSFDANNAFPSNILSKDGKPLLSWRVAILPYIEQDQLYKQFKLDEPWDSDNNKKLIEKMPKQYTPVRVKAKAGETFYQVFVGKDAVFGEKGSRFKLNTIPDGTANTAMVVEAGDPVIWTKPADLPFDAKKDLPKLGGLFDGDFHVAMCDGSVMRVKKDFDAAEMKNLIMPADGNPIDLKKLQKK